MAFDQVKMIAKLQKAQKELKKEIIEVTAGDGAVTVQITGELKIKSIKIYTKYKVLILKASNITKHKK
jgi:DNA-binding protein YbaB